MRDWIMAPGRHAQFTETDDPRVLAVIVEDDTWSAPDGDVFAPAMVNHGREARSMRRVASVYEDDEATTALARAMDHYGDCPATLNDPDSLSRRYMAAFHGVVHIENVGSCIDQYTNVTILDTPSWRKHVGIPPDAGGSQITGDIETWRAYLDGEVYGVGYATSDRTLAGAVDLDDGTWNVTIESYGYPGEMYARESALDLADNFAPTLPKMLDLYMVAETVR